MQKNQLVDYMKSLGYNTTFYIGYCKDEANRYSKRMLNERYPLVEENIIESDILNWAKELPIFNDYYKYNKRCGCMYCPMSSYLNLAYLYKYYPDNFNYMIDKMRTSEKLLSERYNKPFAVRSANTKYNADYVEYIVKNKWIKRLGEI